MNGINEGEVRYRSNHESLCSRAGDQLVSCALIRGILVAALLSRQVFLEHGGGKRVVKICFDTTPPRAGQSQYRS